MKKQGNILSGPNIISIPKSRDSLTAYVFSEQEKLAVETAIALKRPLLVRAEPGHPKREFALAISTLLNWGFIEVDIDEFPNIDNLLWSYDAELRQAEAAIIGSMALSGDEVHRHLDKANFISPGPLWWILDPQSATYQAKMTLGTSQELPSEGDAGCVLFISGADYADDRYLRRIIRILTRRCFDGPSGRQIVGAGDSLVVFATGGERKLPHNFIRGCVVVSEESPSMELLVAWGKAVFANVLDEIFYRAAESILIAREFALNRALPPPGIYDYLDLLGALLAMSSNPEEQLKNLDYLRHYKFPAIDEYEVGAFSEPIHHPEPVPSPKLVPLPESVTTSSQPVVFISYASGIEDQFVEKLYELLVQKGFDTRIDKVDLAYRESVGNYIEKLGEGSAVVVIVSDKYLRSPWCMWELLKIYEAKEFRERVFPIVLGDANIMSGVGRLAYAAYWEYSRNKLDAAMRAVDPLSIAPETVEEGKRIREFAGKVDLLASMVADMSFKAVQKLSEESINLIAKDLKSHLVALSASE
jgi:hypothetical protein